MEKDKLIDKYPDIANEFNIDKNPCFDVNKLTCGSHKKIWWICVKNHEWKQSVAKRVRNCDPECSKCKEEQYLEINALFVKFPNLALEWNYEKNVGIDPKTLSFGVDLKVWWKCKEENSHEWYAKISARTCKKASGCPCCFGRTVTKETSLGFMYPDLICEWDTKKNTLTVHGVTASSHKRVWWICKNNHSYEMMVFEKVRTKKPCQECIINESNLEKLYPYLAKEWHPTKNNDLLPSQVTYGSTQKVWWMCKDKHEWLSNICNRVHGSQCPLCSVGPASRIAMKWLEKIAKTENIHIVHAMNGGEHKINIGNKIIKVDGYCKETNTVYELKGCYWHFHPANQCLTQHSRKAYQANKSNYKMFGDLYIETIERELLIERAGYKLVSIWECEYYDNYDDTSSLLYKKYKNYIKQ